MSCVDDTAGQIAGQNPPGHQEARTQVSWVEPSYCSVGTQQDQSQANSCVVECLCKEREVVDEETGQVKGLRVEKTQWVSRSGGRTMATSICRLSTYLAWVPPYPSPASWLPPSPASAWRSSGSPASAWTSDQDMSVSSLETNNSFLP